MTLYPRLLIAENISSHFKIHKDGRLCLLIQRMNFEKKYIVTYEITRPSYTKLYGILGSDVTVCVCVRKTAVSQRIKGVLKKCLRGSVL